MIKLNSDININYLLYLGEKIKKYEKMLGATNLAELKKFELGIISPKEA